MKCEECQVLIEDYLDSALNQKAAGLVISHMAGCEPCTRVFEELSLEQQVYASYQRDVEVTPVLWSSIEARIKQERAAQPEGMVSRLRERFAGVFAAPRLSPAFAAALVIVAIGMTVAVMTVLNSREPETRVVLNSNSPVETAAGKDNTGASPQPGAPNIARPPEIGKSPGSNERESTASKGGGTTATQRPANLQPKATPAQLVREAEQKYLRAIAMLSRDVNNERSKLDPIMLARFDASLSEIDRTIKESRRVVRENPGDPIALQYLLAAYSKKVDVLREMTNN